MYMSQYPKFYMDSHSGLACTCWVSQNSTTTQTHAGLLPSTEQYKTTSSTYLATTFGPNEPWQTTKSSKQTSKKYRNRSRNRKPFPRLFLGTLACVSESLEREAGTGHAGPLRGAAGRGAGWLGEARRGVAWRCVAQHHAARRRFLRIPDLAENPFSEQTFDPASGLKNGSRMGHSSVTHFGPVCQADLCYLSWPHLSGNFVL